MPSLMAVGGASPYIHIVNAAKRRRLPNPSALPSSNGNGCSFSPDGSLLAVAHQTSPYITIYNTSDWSKLPNPSQLPTGTGNGCSFSPDGSLLAVAHQTSPFITIYNTSDWSKLPNSSALPSNTGNGCSFSPDGSLLAVAHGTSPFITIYNTSDWSAAQDMIHAAGDCRSVAFVQSDGLVLRGEVRDIDGYVASRKVRVYERSTGDLVAETTSSAVDGSYEVAVYEGDVAYDVQFMADPLENLNDLFFAKAIAGAP